MSIYPILKDFFNWISKYKKSLLTKEEKEILKASLSNNHQIHKITTDQGGDFIQNFEFPHDFQKTKSYIYTLETLCKKGLFKQVSEKRYELTAQGFERAKKL